MDVVQAFNDELQSLIDTKPPVSKAKMGLITRAAMKGVKFYKHVVQSVEKFIAKCRPEYKVPGLYVIDSIVRQSRHQFGIERDVYAARFARNLQSTFNNLFAGCLSDDRPKIVRVLNLWQKNGVFNSQVIQPLLDMANPNSTHNLSTESTLSTDSPTALNLESSKGAQTSKHSKHHFTGPNNNQHVKNPSSSSKHYKSDGDSGLRFSKSMLDFEYDEDDDDDGDETPTEAEPPLSSTLNKLEKEQRSRADIPASNMSSQLHHQHQQAQHQQPIASSLTRSDQDPVLERWNRLIKQQSITNEGSRDSNADTNRYHRARSRSPVVRESLPLATTVKEAPKPQANSPIENTAQWAAERKAERARKCFPKIKDKHLTVCSSTLWLGHVPKTVSEADISDAFGEFGSITSIDLIPPRGCAYVCMDRRQDAKKALSESKDLKLNGSHIKMAWAPGKGFKEYKKLKDFWEVDIGSSYIPYAKIDSSIDFEILEEGGVIDEDSMTMEMRELRERRAKEKEEKTKEVHPGLNLSLPALPILTQPSFTMPPPNLSIPPPTALSQNSGLGGIPFPPPNVAPNSNQMPSQRSTNLFDHSSSLDHDNNEALNSPNSLDQQLSMTERQINMVEQQLNMIQQVQGMGQPQQAMAPIHPLALFHHPNHHANHMLFEIHPSQLLHGGPPPTQILDLHQPQQIPIFANPPPLMGQPPPLLPTNQQNMNSNMNGSSMQHYGP